MDDTTIIKLCAQAIGAGPEVSRGTVAIYEKNADGSLTEHIYDPLNDDTQAMELLKETTLDITWLNGALKWRVECFTYKESRSEGHVLNRAICECVAKLESARQSAVSAQKPPSGEL